MLGCGRSLPYVVLDNAKYQKCQKVTDKTKDLNIELVYLPSYSPNLNLIERIWKFIRKEVLGNKYLEDFKTFCQNFIDSLATLHIDYKEKLDSLLSFNFEVLDGNESIQKFH